MFWGQFGGHLMLLVKFGGVFGALGALWGVFDVIEALLGGSGGSFGVAFKGSRAVLGGI